MTTYIVAIELPRLEPEKLSIKAKNEIDARKKVLDLYPDCKIISIKTLLLD